MRATKCFAPAIALTLGLALALASVGSAANWYVKPDGSGDVATIQDAVYESAAGDTIVLADGTFTGDGNRDVYVYHDLTLRSESWNPHACIIDCGGSASENHMALDLRTDTVAGIIVVGITIRGGYNSSTGGVYVTKSIVGGGSVGLVDCLFTQNHSIWAGGALMVVGDCEVSLAGCLLTENTASTGSAVYAGEGSSIVATSCTFAQNSATHDGGAAWVGCGSEGAAAFVGCTFLANTAGDRGGALFADALCVPVLIQCQFQRNSADWGGGALYVDQGVSMTNCVSIGNTATSYSSIWAPNADPVAITSCSFVADSLGSWVMFLGDNPTAVLTKTVIAFATGSIPISCTNPGENLVLTCCNIFGNELGDWTGCIAGQAGVNGNISQDPRFCDIPTGDVSVEDCSPCLAANNSCAQDIGAVGQGCLCGEATVPTTWGSIKALYK